MNLMPEQFGEVIAIHNIGPHCLKIERPDIVHIHYVGDVNLEQFKVIDRIVLDIPEPSDLYLLRDARRGGITTPATRAHLARSPHVLRWCAVVTYGASFQAQTMVRLTNKAIRLLNDKQSEVVFVDTEAKARAWIAKHRQQLVEARDSANRSWGY
jgi:hypothetical protein